MRKKSLILLTFFTFYLTIRITFQAEQLTFLLDLDSPYFNFTVNTLNDSSYTKDVIFSDGENITVFIRIPKNSKVFFSNITLKGQMKPIQSSAIEEIFDLDIGNVLPSSENEIAIAAYEHLILLNNSLGEKWKYDIPGVIVYGVGIGNLSSDIGSEVVAGAANSKIYILNSSGNLKLSKDLGGIAYSVAIGNVNASNEYDEIVVGGGDSKVYLFDSNGNEIWNYSTSGSVYGVGIGNLSSDIGSEVVAGAAD
ncbi:MAG TPA: hypothetical protein ENG45_01505, partial [Candidatus Aenigmarchaeota archaeon]|nr:hypothetical protein [Candidatus Aenigmarchaeota archaeon]